MTLLSLLKELALAAGRGAASRVAELVRGTPRDEPEAKGLSHQEVEQQQAQIRSATAFKVRPKD